jgi:hypothetical protein
VPDNRPSDTVRPTGAYLTGTLLYITFGVLVWAAHLTLVYFVHAVVCARGYTPELLPGLTLPTIFVIAATFVALFALSAAGYLPRLRRHLSSGRGESEEERIFERRLMYWLTLLAAVGILWGGATAVLVAPCVALR